MRPPCELRQPRDAQTLLQAGAISGSLDVRAEVDKHPLMVA